MQTKDSYVATDDFSIKTLEFRLGALHEDVRDVRSSMNKLADAITKLALIEERQVNTNVLVGQVNHKLDAMEARINQLEINAPSTTRTSMWVDRAVLFAVGAMGMFIAKSVGLIGP